MELGVRICGQLQESDERVTAPESDSVCVCWGGVELSLTPVSPGLSTPSWHCIQCMHREGFASRVGRALYMFIFCLLANI